MSDASHRNGPEARGAEEAPGLPRLRTWRGVYLFVLGAFVVMVGLLTWFTHVFAR